MFENEINTKNDQGNTPLHFACLTGNLEIVKILLSFQNGFSTVPGVSGSSQPGAGQGIEMCAVNKEGLLPIHLAIARSRYFIVHHLLRQEQVLLHLISAPFDLYMCLKLAITYRSIQILKLLYQVFQEQIDGVAGKRSSRSFWERPFKEKGLSQLGLKRALTQANRFGDKGIAGSKSADSRILEELDEEDKTITTESLGFDESSDHHFIDDTDNH